jgi:hypothetical protein
MSKKEKFLLFTALGAMARDLATQSTEAFTIMNCAAKIPEEQIPPNAINAAQVYLAHLDRADPPFKWMCVRKERYGPEGMSGM